MKKIAVLSLSVFTMMAFGGCTFTNDALFPSLVGTDSQTEIAARNSIAAENDIPQLGTTNFEPVEISKGGNTGTFVGQKVVSFRTELSQLQASIRRNNDELQKVRSSVINNALQYHKVIGLIEAKLQVGTTPGNPQMFTMLQNAQNNIQVMNANSTTLSQLATRVASDADMTRFLADSIRAAYGVSGAVDEDHRQLRILENETNQTSILINSLLSEINSDIARQQQYIETAKNYIVDLSGAIKTGSFGVSNVPMTSVHGTYAPASRNRSSVSNDSISGKPLFVAKFNKQDVKYKDGLKEAVSRAIAKKPSVMFDVVAVSPSNGSQLSQSTARNHAGTIFQEMVEMGVGPEKISLAAKTSDTATSSEVHIYVK